MQLLGMGSQVQEIFSTMQAGKQRVRRALEGNPWVTGRTSSDRSLTSLQRLRAWTLAGEHRRYRVSEAGVMRELADNLLPGTSGNDSSNFPRSALKMPRPEFGDEVEIPLPLLGLEHMMSDLLETSESFLSSEPAVSLRYPPI